MNMKKVLINMVTVQNRILSLMMIILFTVLIISCNRDDGDESTIIGGETENPNGEINEWILENMEVYYLWETHLPSKTDKTLSPDDYFESLLYHPDDRFSWIQENYLDLLNSLSGVSTEAGYDYNLTRMSQNGSEVIGYITYIKPGTPAAAAGLMRGNYFHKINGTQMTVNNYSSLIAQTSRQHTLGVSVLSGNTIVGIKNIALDVVENYPENPILLDSIYNISDKKIGYFVYNFFARDKGDGSVSYEKELNNLFQKFKSERINELIVDLRYNSGGAVITTEALASMISGQPTDKVFYLEEYNQLLNKEFNRIYGKDYNKTYFIDNIERYNNSGRVIENIPINRLSGLSTLYCIVSRRSASASELLINGLKPYMNVVLIGETTYGKNVGSITIYEDDPVKQKTNKWGMQPIILKIANANNFSEYGEGFIPDKEMYEHNTDTIKQLGDTEELLLHATINKIFGTEEDILPTTKHLGNQTSVIASSVDKTPARKNQYITPKKLRNVK
jgi:C-terminal processing protease CtpA/Prc